MRWSDDGPMQPEVAAALAAVDATLAGEPADPDYAELAELALILRRDRPRAVGPLPRGHGREGAAPVRPSRACARGGPSAVAVRAWGGGGRGGRRRGRGDRRRRQRRGQLGPPAAGPSRSRQPRRASTTAANRRLPVAGSAAPGRDSAARSGNLVVGPVLGAGLRGGAGRVVPIVRGGVLGGVVSATRTPASAASVAGSGSGAVRQSPDRPVRAAPALGGAQPGRRRRPAGVRRDWRGEGHRQQLQRDRRGQRLRRRLLPAQRAQRQPRADADRAFPSARRAGRFPKRRHLRHHRSGRRRRDAPGRGAGAAPVAAHAACGATTTEQVDSIKLQLRDADASIASDLSALRGLQRQVAYSRIALTIQSATVVAPAKGSSFTLGRAAHDAGRVLVIVAGVALITLAVLVPVGLLAALAAWIGMAIRRRRREQALDLV